MHKFKNLMFAFSLFAMVALYACTDCDPNLNEDVGDEFFTVTYRTQGGVNYLESIYNIGNITVWVDTTGGEKPSQIELITPGYEDNKFGPFNFTDRFLIPTSGLPNYVVLLGRTHRFDYHIKKDTFGTDILSVEFRLEADECNNNWNLIRYYLNGTELDAYRDDQFADIVIVE